MALSAVTLTINQRRFWLVLILAIVGLGVYLWLKSSSSLDVRVERATRKPKIPDVVHFFHFDSELTLSFISATCILAVFINHNPSTIILHTDKNLTTGRYLDIVKDVVGSKLQIKVDPKS